MQANKKLIGSKQSNQEKEGLAHGMAIEALKRVPFAGNAVSMAEYGETGVPIADTVITGARSVGELVTDRNQYGGHLSPRGKTKAEVDAAVLAGEVLGVPGASTAGQIYKNRIMPPPKK